MGAARSATAASRSSTLGTRPSADAAITTAELAITFNGEIYNLLEVRERLRGLGHTFSSDSDTEVLLRAYRQWGSDCLAELTACSPSRSGTAGGERLFCARDRFGEKPFVYAIADGAFAFASEAKALALLAASSTEMDDGVLAAYAEDGSTAIDGSERTLLRGVRQLLPAHAMEVAIAGAVRDRSGRSALLLVRSMSRPARTTAPTTARAPRATCSSS